MIYLDHNASTPLRLEARAALTQVTGGNPSSLHAAGRASRQALEAAQKVVRRLVNAPSTADVVFTGSGSEADNLAVLGLARARRAAGADTVLVSAIEHPAVLVAAERLAGEGFSVHRIPVDRSGRVDLLALARLVGPKVAVLSVMLANNETGVVQPVQEAAELAARAGVPTHTDAVQAAGKIGIDMTALAVTCLSLSAHKFGGPRGVGALVVNKGTKLTPLWHGGGQQGGLRSGTPAVSLASAMAAAAEAAMHGGEAARLAELRDRLQAALLEVAGAHLTSHEAPRLPNTLSVGFAGVPSYSLVDKLSQEGVMASAGAACHADEVKPSDALLAMGLSRERASEVVRLSVGWSTTSDEIDAACRQVPACVAALRVA